MYVYVVQTGSLYEGGGTDEVFSSFEAALASKPDCFTLDEDRKHKNNEKYSIWTYGYEDTFFSISRFKLLSKTNFIIKRCVLCKITHRSGDLYMEVCNLCDRECSMFRNTSLDWFERRARNMHEALS